MKIIILIIGLFLIFLSQSFISSNNDIGIILLVIGLLCVSEAALKINKRKK